MMVVVVAVREKRRLGLGRGRRLVVVVVVVGGVGEKNMRSRMQKGPGALQTLETVGERALLRAGPRMAAEVGVHG